MCSCWEQLCKSVQPFPWVGFCGSRVPAVKSRSSFPLVLSFHTLVTPLLFFLIHSLLVPSLALSATLSRLPSSPASLALADEWLMNEEALWSQESRRGRSSVKRCRTKDGREGERRGGEKRKEERSRGRVGVEGGRGGGGAFNKGERQTENIHKVSEGRRAECVWRRRKTEGEEGGREGEQRLHFCMSASGYLHCGAQHAKRPAARKRKITQVMTEWRLSGAGLLDCRGRREVFGVWGTSNASTLLLSLPREPTDNKISL